MPSPKTLVALSLIAKPVVYTPKQGVIVDPIEGQLHELSVVFSEHSESLKKFIRSFLYMRNTGNQYITSEMRHVIDGEPQMYTTKRKENLKHLTEENIKTSLNNIASFCNYAYQRSAKSPADRAQMAVIQTFLKDCCISMPLHGDNLDSEKVIKRFFTRHDTGEIVPYTDEALAVACKTTNAFSFYRVDFDKNTSFQDRACVMQLFTDTLQD